MGEISTEVVLKPLEVWDSNPRVAAYAMESRRCPICYDSPECPWSCPTEDQHTFCRVCIKVWIDNTSKTTIRCPGDNCRYELTLEDIATIRRSGVSADPQGVAD